MAEPFWRDFTFWFMVLWSICFGVVIAWGEYEGWRMRNESLMAFSEACRRAKEDTKDSKDAKES